MGYFEIHLLPLCVLLPFFFLAFFSTGSQTPCAECTNALQLNDVLEKINQTQSPTPPLLPTALVLLVPPNIRYYNFLLQWPPSVCTQEDTHCYGLNVPRRFTIQGLLTTVSEGGVTIEYCNPGDKLDWSKLVDLEEELSTKWPTLSNSITLQDFLSYQWSRYGTCSGLTQLEYFQSALILNDLIDLDHKLLAINVVPGATKYNPATVIKDFEYKYKIEISSILCANKSETPLVEMIRAFEFPVSREFPTMKPNSQVTNKCRTKAVEFPP